MMVYLVVERQGSKLYLVENKAHYNDIKKGKAEPFKFDQKKYDEYIKNKDDENL